MVREAFSDAFYSRGISKEVKTLNFVPAGYYSVDINSEGLRGLIQAMIRSGKWILMSMFLSPEGKEIYRKTISRKIGLERKDNLNLAKSLSSALSEAVDEAMTGIAALSSDL